MNRSTLFLFACALLAPGVQARPVPSKATGSFLQGLDPAWANGKLAAASLQAAFSSIKGGFIFGKPLVIQGSKSDFSRSRISVLLSSSVQNDVGQPVRLSGISFAFNLPRVVVNIKGKAVGLDRGLNGKLRLVSGVRAGQVLPIVSLNDPRANGASNSATLHYVESCFHNAIGPWGGDCNAVSGSVRVQSVSRTRVVFEMQNVHFEREGFFPASQTRGEFTLNGRIEGTFG